MSELFEGSVGWLLQCRWTTATPLLRRRPKRRCWRRCRRPLERHPDTFLFFASTLRVLGMSGRRLTEPPTRLSPPRGGTSVARPGWPRAMLLLRSRRRRMGRRRRLLLRPAASGWLCHGVGLASVLSTRPRLPSVRVRCTVVSRSLRPRSFRSMSGRRLCARHRGRGWPELALHGDYVAAIFGAGCGPPSLHCAVFSLPSARFDLG